MNIPVKVGDSVIYLWGEAIPKLAKVIEINEDGIRFELKDIIHYQCGVGISWETAQNRIIDIVNDHERYNNWRLTLDVVDI